MFLTALRRWYWNRHRAIFHYHDGHRRCKIDPVAALIALNAHPRYLQDRHILEANEGDPQAIAIMQEAARDVFGVQPFDGRRGLTISETIDLLIGFDNYLLSLKKSGSLSPTPPQSTDATYPESSDGTTSDTLDCGSIDTDNRPDDPPKSETESRPASAESSSLSGSLT